MTAKRPSDESGAALELALIFVTAIAVIVGALLGFAGTSSQASTVTRTARGFDYDADAAMQAAIATIRADTVPTSNRQGYVGNCASFTPAFTLNNADRPIRVDCSPFAASAAQRHVVLSVCPSAIAPPCPDASALLRADVIFYDDTSYGRAVSIQSWSNQ